MYNVDTSYIYLKTNYYIPTKEVYKVANGRRGKAASDIKIRDAIKNAKTPSEVYDILERGRFNLTNEEERQIVTVWIAMQRELKIHGKGAFAPKVAEVV